MLFRSFQKTFIIVAAAISIASSFSLRSAFLHKEIHHLPVGTFGRWQDKRVAGLVPNLDV